MDKKSKKVLLLIFILALLFRVWKLSSFPMGFHADEVRVGWNAFSILKTGLDDRGNLLALYYNTFGDYRPTGIFYTTIPSIILFGLNEFAVRFPSALIGALSIFPLYLISLILSKSRKVALLSSFLLAVSPWHIVTSRATSEVVISMFFALFGIYFTLKSVKSQKEVFLIPGISFFLISYLFYHSIRLTAPIFVFAILIYYWKTLEKEFKKHLITAVALLGFLTLVFISSKGGWGRFSQVAFLKTTETTQVLGAQTKWGETKTFAGKAIDFSQNFSKQYLTYFSGSFLVGDDAKPLRYKTPNIGVLTYFEFFIVLSGVIYVLQKKDARLPLYLLLISPIPAALTFDDSPNLHRSLFMLPFIIIIGSLGLVSLFKKHKLFGSLLIFGLFLNLGYFLNQYYVEGKLAVVSYRNFSAKELAFTIKESQGNYDSIILTHDPDDPYPWYAFYNKLDPKELNSFAIERKKGPWTYKNIVFTQIECPSDSSFPQNLKENILVIDGFKCATGSKISDGINAKVKSQIKDPTGETKYTLWEKR